MNSSKVLCAAALCIVIGQAALAVQPRGASMMEYQPTPFIAGGQDAEPVSVRVPLRPRARPWVSPCDISSDAAASLCIEEASASPAINPEQCGLVSQSSYRQFQRQFARLYYHQILSKRLLPNCPMNVRF